jgi:hypothetical protein
VIPSTTLPSESSTSTTASSKSDVVQTYIHLVTESMAAGLIEVLQLKQSLELNQLSELQLIKDETACSKQIVRLNTSMVFKQQKYNLTREETEGFSKLTLILQSMNLQETTKKHFQTGSSKSEEDFEMENILKAIYSVIGQFDLEPNRVLDIILDSFEQYPRHIGYPRLLQSFKTTYLPHLLGFKYQHYLQQKLDIPTSCLLVTAQLIHYQNIRLEDVIAYLQPSLEDTGNLLKKAGERLKRALNSTTQYVEFIQKGSIVTTTALSAPISSSLTTAAPGSDAEVYSMLHQAHYLKIFMEQRKGSHFQRGKVSILIDVNVNSTEHSNTTNATNAVASDSKEAIQVTSSSTVGLSQTTSVKLSIREMKEREKEKEREKVSYEIGK